MGFNREASEILRKKLNFSNPDSSVKDRMALIYTSVKGHQMRTNESKVQGLKDKLKMFISDDP